MRKQEVFLAPEIFTRISSFTGQSFCAMREIRVKAFPEIYISPSFIKNSGLSNNVQKWKTAFL
jgi:hypothetical protein